MEGLCFKDSGVVERCKQESIRRGPAIAEFAGQDAQSIHEGRTMLTGRLMGSVWVVCLMALAVTLGGCNSIPPETGPTMGVRNDSDAPLRATFWVGERAAQRAGMPADMSQIDQLEIPPGGTKQFRLGAFSGYESATASFVRVQVEPVGSSFQLQSQHWFELNPPSPYIIRVSGLKPKLQFERAGGGTLVAVPRDLWFRSGSTATVIPRKSNTPVAGGLAPASTAKPRTALTTPAAKPAGASAIKPMTAPGTGTLADRMHKNVQPNTTPKNPPLKQQAAAGE